MLISSIDSRDEDRTKRKIINSPGFELMTTITYKRDHIQQFRCKLKDDALQKTNWFLRSEIITLTHLLSIRQADVMAVELDAIFMHHSSNELSIEGESSIIEGGSHG